MKLKNNLCQFFNMEADKDGAVFVLCDKHLKNQKTPDACILKWRGKTDEECSSCAEES